MQELLVRALGAIVHGAQVSKTEFMQLYNIVYSKTITDETVTNIFLNTISQIMEQYICTPVHTTEDLHKRWEVVQNIEKYVQRVLKSRAFLVSKHPELLYSPSEYFSLHLEQLLQHNAESPLHVLASSIYATINSRQKETHTICSYGNSTPLSRFRFTRTKNQYQDLTFATIENPSTIRIDLPLQKHAFVLENLLTREECNRLISDSVKLGYKSIENEFLLCNRDNKRILVMTPTFTDVIWSRMKPFLENDSKITNLIPFGFNSQGRWKPTQLNSCWRFCEYTGHSNSVGFKPHRDTNFLLGQDQRSIFTCMVYLNDDFEGGRTDFLQSTGSRMDETIEQELARGYKKTYSLQPKAGMAVIFDHALIHEGLPVLSGMKYIARTDVLFTRYENPSSDDSWKVDDNYLRMTKYYKDAADAECMGNVAKSSELYERALSIRQNNLGPVD